MEAKKPPLQPLCRDESALLVRELGINEIRKVSLLLLGNLTMPRAPPRMHKMLAR